MPSRGLIHSRVIERLLPTYDRTDSKIFFTHDKGIPDCFNDLTQRALEWGADILWFIEDDNGIEDDTYDKMIKYIDEYPVVTHNYPINPTHNVIQDKDDRLFFGTGCTMIRRDILEGYTWQAKYNYALPDYRRIEIPEKARSRMYGMHDIEFAVYCYNNKIPIKALREHIAHYKVEEMGDMHKNKGWHIIYDIRDKIITSKSSAQE